MKTIVLINGPKRGGKDYSASILTELLKDKIDVKSLSFAYPLKKIMADTFGISLEMLDELKNDKESLFLETAKLDGFDYREMTDFRTLLQRFSAYGMKPQFGEAVWANLLLSKILDDDKSQIILVPDFRFDIESEIIKSSAYRVITLKIRNDAIDVSDSHASERELDDYIFDYTIDNTGYSKNLDKKLEEFIRINNLV